MNENWSDMNKHFQILLKKESTFKEGINQLLDLRKLLFDEMISFLKISNRDYLIVNPFNKEIGNDSKTVIYSIYHLIRIEDIVSNILVMKKESDVFLSNNFKEIINLSIVTTGNELTKAEIIEFSTRINAKELLRYVEAVYNMTNKMLQTLLFTDLAIKISTNEKNNLLKLNVVSEDEMTSWLIDYWCKKDIRGLIQMPFSRHWIMHIEASKRIINKFNKQN